MPECVGSTEVRVWQLSVIYYLSDGCAFCLLIVAFAWLLGTPEWSVMLREQKKKKKFQCSVAAFSQGDAGSSLCRTWEFWRTIKDWWVTTPHCRKLLVYLCYIIPWRVIVWPRKDLDTEISEVICTRPSTVETLFNEDPVTKEHALGYIDREFLLGSIPDWHKFKLHDMKWFNLKNTWSNWKTTLFATIGIG